MANRPQPVKSVWQVAGTGALAGVALAGGLFALAFAAIAALLMATRGSAVTGGMSSSYILHVTVFTLFQASLSAVLSLLVAIPVALSCWRRQRQWNARVLVTISFLPFVMPTTVAATGLIGVWGQNGFVSESLRAFGVGSLPPIYGLGGVLLAHVFLNAPLMLRVLTGSLAGIPASQWRLSSQWGLSPLQRFQLIEWPAIRRVIPGLLALVFLVCFTSFSLVLMLGGGPSVTTLEVSIYTALRFDFNLPLAALLSCFQLGICSLVVLILAAFTGPSWASLPDLYRACPEQLGDSSLSVKSLDGLILAAFGGLIFLPLLALLVRGIGLHLVTVMQWPAFYRAAINSILIALGSGFLATLCAFTLAHARTRLAVAGKPVAGLDIAVSLYLAVSAIVLGTGLFILLRGVADVFFMAPALVMLANMLVALPFAYRVLEGRMAGLAKSHDRLCAGLGIRGWRRLKHITLPAMAPEIGYASGLASALSLGDMTVIALFGSQQFQTLPWLLYQTMARYRAGEAAALAVILLTLTLVLFTSHILFAKRFRRGQHA